MKFYRRDAVLAAGCALVGAGTAVYLSPVLAAAVAAGIFFAIKIFSTKSSKAMLDAAKGGVCVQCGQNARDCACES